MAVRLVSKREDGKQLYDRNKEEMSCSETLSRAVVPHSTVPFPQYHIITQNQRFQYLALILGVVELLSLLLPQHLLQLHPKSSQQFK
jgi:hypothetical protein